MWMFKLCFRIHIQYPYIGKFVFNLARIQTPRTLTSRGREMEMKCSSGGEFSGIQASCHHSSLIRKRVLVRSGEMDRYCSDNQCPAF